MYSVYCYVVAAAAATTGQTGTRRDGAFVVPVQLPARRGTAWAARQWVARQWPTEAAADTSHRREKWASSTRPHTATELLHSHRDTSVVKVYVRRTAGWERLSQLTGCMIERSIEKELSYFPQ